MKKIPALFLSIIVTLLFLTDRVNAQTEFWGMSRSGGSAGLGTIFKTDANGENPVLIHSFTDTLNGFNPEGSLVKVRNGKLYGLTKFGGIHNMGTLFEYDMFTNTFQKLVDFDSVNTGSYPSGTLCYSTFFSDFQGMTGKGGLNNKGVKFSYSPYNGMFTTRYHFDTITGGENPASSIIYSPDIGILGFYDYGLICVNPTGGQNNTGTISRFSLLSDTLQYSIPFPAFANGVFVQSDLLEISPGIFLGLSVSGGDSSGGFIFEYSESSGSINQKVSFGTVSGTFPQGKLVRGENGKYYGLTSEGGASSQGTLFEYDYTNNLLTIKADFGTSLNDISSPHGSLLNASNGKLYGMGTYGSNCGSVLFEFDPASNQLTEKTNLCSMINVVEPYFTTLIEIDSDSTLSVWPGDCDNNLVVNNIDFLYLGMIYHETGPVRQGAVTDFIAQPCAQWSLTLPISSSGPINAKHIDCDGNGIVDSMDASAIYKNYSKRHVFRTKPPSTGLFSHDYLCLAPLRNSIAPGDPAEYEIRIGGLTPPVDYVYGIAFTIQFDPLLVDTGRISFDYTSSILGSPGFDMMSFRQNDFTSGLIHLALVRKDRVNYFNPGGSLGILKLYTHNGITAPVQLQTNPKSVMSIEATGHINNWHTCSTDILIDPSLTSVDRLESNQSIHVYPNPAKNIIRIESTNRKILKVGIYSLSGKKILGSSLSQEKISLSLKDIAPGIYFMELQLDGHLTQYKKLIIE